MTREELLNQAKPILFNTEMVKAILGGRKTVTRRVVKGDTEGLYAGSCALGAGLFCVETHLLVIGPSFHVGDYLYVRETWQCWRAHRYEANADIRFKAGGEGVRLEFANGNTDSIDRFDYDSFVNKWFSYNGEWKPSLFMPKEVARIFLKVTDVRVERLQDITEEQATREGCQAGSHIYYGAVWGQEDTVEWTVVEAFEGLWNSTIKKADLDKYGWDANPWVWVIEFERVEV